MTSDPIDPVMERLDQRHPPMRKQPGIADGALTCPDTANTMSLRGNVRRFPQRVAGRYPSQALCSV